MPGLLDRSTLWWLACAVALCCALAACDSSGPSGDPPTQPGPAVAATSAAATNVFARRGGRHALLTAELSDSGATLIDARVVQVALPKSRKLLGARWLVQVADAGGHTLFETTVAPADQIRGEFPGPDGTLERVADVRAAVAVVAVRTPVIDVPATVRFTAFPEDLHPADARRRSPPKAQADGRILLGEFAFPQVTP